MLFDLPLNDVVVEALQSQRLYCLVIEYGTNGVEVALPSFSAPFGHVTATLVDEFMMLFAFP